MELISDSLLPNTTSRPKDRSQYRFGFVKPVFWTIFVLNYLYLGRLLLILTDDKFRFGFVILGLSTLAIIINLRVVKNIPLFLAILVFSGIVLLSTLTNNVTLIKFAAFIRIPLTVYLVYHLVRSYLKGRTEVYKVLKAFYYIALFQLPIIAFQRITYDILPAGFRITTTAIDFGMGTFSGDTEMAFTLIGLTILLLFDQEVKRLFHRRLLIAGWFTLTVLFSNSQVQHITIILVWVIFLLSHLRFRTIISGIALFILVSGALVSLSNLGIMSFPYLTNTLIKLSEVKILFEGEADYSDFLRGEHARAAAVHYYVHQPIKWIGDGPGSVYDTSTGTRTVGGWGHIFTFYAEVGIIGLLLSYYIFFVIAVPIRQTKGNLFLRPTWVGFLMFLAVFFVSIVKYPMGDSSMVFTYCIFLVIHQTLSKQSQSNPYPHSLSEIVTHPS